MYLSNSQVLPTSSLHRLGMYMYCTYFIFIVYVQYIHTYILMIFILQIMVLYQSICPFTISTIFISFLFFIRGFRQLFLLLSNVISGGDQTMCSEFTGGCHTDIYEGPKGNLIKFGYIDFSVIRRMNKQRTNLCMKISVLFFSPN